MSYAGSYSGAYGAGYAPAAMGPVSSGDEMLSATIEAPPVAQTRPIKPDYNMQDFFTGGEEIDEFHPRTLYVGNLEISISEEFLMQLFGQIGPVTKCKIIHELKVRLNNSPNLTFKQAILYCKMGTTHSPVVMILAGETFSVRELLLQNTHTANDPYAFIEFQEHLHAVQALTAMNKRVLMGKEMRVNWATSPGAQQRVDTSKHYHVFVGDLSPEIDNRTLREAFAPFGQISDVKVIRDLQTLKSKGYGFVSFVQREEAERAIEQMNGQWLGRRAIRTNWATRKPGMPGPSYGVRDRGLTLEEIMAQASPTNSTVYVGGVGGNTTDDDLRQVFIKYGTIVEVRVFRQQGYAFVRFDNKESAGQSICNLNNTEINGSVVRCSWGKEGGYASSGQYPNYGYGYGYGYGGSGGVPPAPQNPPSSQNYWNQYYQYYNDPSGYQQWQNYWQGGQGGPQ